MWPTLPEHPSSPPILSGIRVARFLVFCVLLCIVCPSSIYASELTPPLLLISPIFSNRGYFIISRHKKGPGGIGVMYLIRPTQTSNAHEEETVDLFFLS